MNKCYLYSLSWPLFTRGGKVLTHIFVQFHWRQHLSPKAHPSSDSQPVVDSHVGMGFGAGHVPGRVPEKKKSKIKLVDLFLCISTGFLKARKGEKKGLHQAE